jgi:hypothetical protein
MAYSIEFDAGLSLEFGLNMGKRVHTPIGVRVTLYPRRISCGAVYPCRAVYLDKAVYDTVSVFGSVSVFDTVSE